MTPGSSVAPALRVAPGCEPVSIGPANPSAPKIGPNAVLQTLAAVRDLEGQSLEAAVSARAGLGPPSEWSPGLIPEAWFVATIEALRRELPDPSRREAVMAEAGRRTASYVAVHRVPKPFRSLLGALPRSAAVPALLAAFARHAWTFAGRGQFSVEGRRPRVLVLDDAPTCRGRSEPGDGERRGRYYEAAFEGLLALCGPDIHVHEVACRSQGADACRFRIEYKPRAESGV